MLPSCQTDQAIVLVAVRDHLGVLRFPISEKVNAPGVWFDVKPLLPINPQIVDALSQFFARDVGVHVTIEQNFFDAIVSDAERSATLYLATLHHAPENLESGSWVTMPELLRKLSGRSRLPYLRAWQVFAGGLHLDTKAIEKSLTELRELADK